MNISIVEGYTRIYQVDTFSSSFSSLFSKSAEQKQSSLKKLNFNLRILEDNGFAALEMQQFEKLKTTDPPLYCIRNVGQMNPRTVFVLYTEPEGFLLLHCFLEKNKSDYQKAIKQAHNILKRLEEE